MKKLLIRLPIIAVILLACVILSPSTILHGQASTSGWSVQFGTAAEDNLSNVAVDSVGNVFCAGDTLGTMTGTAGTGDMFLSKRDANGNLLWTKQFGTASGDGLSSIAVDLSGNVYVVGDTNGQLFGPTSAAYMDSFIAKYDPNGNLIWGRQIVGTGFSQAMSLVIGADGSLYVAGATDGNYGGPNAGTTDPSVALGSDDVYVMKLSSDGITQWTKQFGATGADVPDDIALDQAGNIIITGTTYHWLRASHGGRDIFLAKLGQNGTIIWNSEFGGTLDNFPTALYANSAGNIFLATAEGGSQTQYGQPTPGQCNLYSFSSSGQQIWMRSFVTSTSTDQTEIMGISGNAGNFYIAGNTTGNLFGLNDGSQNIFVAQLGADGSVIAANQLGSGGTDSLSNLVADIAGNLYIAGDTDGNWFATNLGENDIFLEKQSAVMLAAQPTRGLARKGFVCTNWKGKLIPLQYPSFHRGLTAYAYAGYLCSGIPGARVRQTAAKQIVVEGPSKQVVISPGSLTYWINGKARKMSVRPVMVANHCYVPLDVMKAVLPYPVHYDAKAQTVHFDPPQKKLAHR